MKRARFSLQSKLILSFVSVAVITVLVVSVLIRVTANQSLMNLVTDQQTAQLSEAVQSYYASNGSLDGFFENYLRTGGFTPGENQPSSPGAPPRNQVPRGVHGLVDLENRAVMPTLGYDLGSIVPAEKVSDRVAVKVDGETVAYIVPDVNHQFSLNPEEELFLQRSTLAIGLAALAGILVAVAMGFLLAGRLTKPIRQLIQAARALARGDLKQQVKVSSSDEIGELTTTFNQMSADLAHADDQRKRMTADITHDLSTPLQIISGYMEIIENDATKLNPGRIEIIKTEIEHLRRLVSDLTTLSQIEAGGMEVILESIQPAKLLERVRAIYQPIAARQGVELEMQIPASCPSIQVDEGRMMQVLKNLVDNALRYTPKGGRITLQATCGNPVILRVSDSGSGIEPEDLPFVFDRFYRADKARGGNAGKMGLGLSICKALVTAQGGMITAESEGSGRGTSMVISFQAGNDNP